MSSNEVLVRFTFILMTCSCALVGGVDEAQALVEADEAGTTALLQAGFQIQIAQAAAEHIKRTSETFGHSHT